MILKETLKDLLFQNEKNNITSKTNTPPNDPNNRKWFRLDNAAKLYPVIMKRSYISLFRISANTHEIIDKTYLQNALDNIIDRFPYYKVRLRRGFFWYYFEKIRNRLQVEEDVQNPCRPMRRKENYGYLIRVRYYNNRVAAEFFHGLTDASGALIFLKTLLAEYFRISINVKMPFEKGVFNPVTTPESEEYEDSYNKYANFKVIRRPKADNAYKIKGTQEFPHTLHIVTGIIPLDAIKSKSKESGVSITEYLVSVLIEAIYTNQRNGPVRNIDKPIQVSIPVNMRNHYPSKTMRNFSLFTSPGIEPEYGDYSFTEILQNIHHYMRFQLNSKYMNALMCANVSSEKHTIVKLVPLVIKNIAMMIGYKKFGILKYTSTFSNLGIVEVPKEMEDLVDRFDLVVGPCTYNPVNIGLLSYKDKLYINFSDTIKEKNIQRNFFTHLVKAGIPVKIETNEVWMDEK
jgi:NRPS condensation-like uncharacterized protein